MAKFFKRLFGGKESEPETPPEEEPTDPFYEEKSEAMVEALGEEADSVYHAIIPFDAGGPVDIHLYPFPEFGGCGFATQELIKSDGSGPIPHEYGPYELVSFTKYPLTKVQEEGTPFFDMVIRMRFIMTAVGRYGHQAKLKPFDTCEVPASEKGEPNHCLIFAHWPEEGLVMEIMEEDYSLQLVVEVFREEMEFARQYGTRELIKLLEEAGHWPYSDLDRKMVVHP